MASAANSPPRADEWIEALRAARLRETAHFEARARINDAKRLRLQVLKEELSGLVPPSETEIGMTVSPGEPPYLWLDLVTSVVMEPEPNTYRLIEDTESGRQVLFETTDRAAMAEQVKNHLAHRTIFQERHRLAISRSTAAERYSAQALIVAWLTGFGVAALIFVCVAFYLKFQSY